MLKTSDQWLKEHELKVTILDFDGWDRGGDFEYSFYQEKISKEEFTKRLCQSTIQWNTSKL